MTEPTVLIVEDESDVAEVLAYSLKREGYRVTTAREAAEGLAIAKGEPPDVILLDVMMPGISGWEMLERLRSQDATKAIPVIVVTVLGDPRYVEKAAALDAAGFIRKPFKPDEVIRTVRGVLRQRETD